MATHSSILSWKMPWTEEPGRVQSMRSVRVGHNLATEHTHVSVYTHTHTHTTRLSAQRHRLVQWEIAIAKRGGFGGNQENPRDGGAW